MRRALPFAVVVGLVLCAVLLVRDVVAAGRAFAGSERALESVQVHLRNADLPAAQRAADAAQDHVAAVGRHLDGPLWAALAAFPFTRGTVATTRAAHDLSLAASRTATTVAYDGDVLFDEDGRLRLEVRDGAVDLALLAKAGDVLDRVPLADLEGAVAELSRTRWWIPSLVREARDKGLERARDVVETVQTAHAVTEQVPLWLGAQGKRRYLIAFQNPAELRGTGGFLGFLGVMEVEDGHFSLGESVGFDPADETPTGGVVRRERIDDATLEPVAAPADFATRYDPVAGRSFFGSVNLDPDFPTVAPVMLELWAARTGDGGLDGVIALDPFALREILRVTGPMDVPDAVSNPRLPDPISAEQVIQTLLVDAYDVLGGGSPARQRYHEEVARAAFTTLFSADWPPRPMLEALAGAAAQRHLQVYSRAAAEQDLWARLDVAGGFGPTSNRADFLGLSYNNSGANKSDIHVEHSLDVRYEILTVDTTTMMVHRRVSADVGLRNDLVPDGHDRYLIESTFPQGPGEPRRIDPRVAHNRTWFTLWAPGGSLLREAVQDGVQMAVGENRMHGLAAFDGELQTASRATSRPTLVFEGWVPLAGTAEAPRLLLDWSPPRTGAPWSGTITLQAPDGWRVGPDTHKLPRQALDGAAFKLFRLYGRQ